MADCIQVRRKAQGEYRQRAWVDSRGCAGADENDHGRSGIATAAGYRRARLRLHAADGVTTGQSLHNANEGPRRGGKV